MKKNMLIALAIICSITLMSCGGSRTVVAERPVAPSYQRPFSPGPNHVWIEGDWVIRNGRYAQQPGYWAAPRSNRRWENGHW